MEGKSKKWKYYFLEFFMLFLAVSLGFLGENFREKYSERAKEKEYIISMIEDVEQDRLNLEKVIKSNIKRSEYLDTLGNLCLKYISSPKNNIELYKYFPIVLYRPDFIDPTELTMEQLKNAGGMRLIKSKKAIKEIIRYDSKLKKIANQQVYYENYHNNSINIGTKIFNLQKFISASQNKNKDQKPEDFDLINTDNLKLKEFGNTVLMYKGIVDYYVFLLKQMDLQAKDLIQNLQEEYQLK